LKAASDQGSFSSFSGDQIRYRRFVLATNLQVDETLIKTSRRIFNKLSDFQPYSSISFIMTDQILSAVQEGRRLTDWGMAKNKTKLKDAALEIIDEMSLVSPGDPVNLNLDDYQLKSMAEVSSIHAAALENKKDGLKLIRSDQE
jgi:hypothetical protein